jgi:hypothetical protein
VAITKGTFKAYAAPAAAGATSISTTGFDSTAAGLLVSAAIFEGANTTCVFSDNQTGNTWATAVVTALTNQFSIHCAMSWCVPVDKDAAHTVTCTFGASRTQRRICVLPVNGSFSASDAEAATAQSNDGNGSPVDAGSLVTTTAAILVQAVGDNAAQNFSPGTDWDEDSATAGSHFQSRIEAAGGTFDPVGTGIGYDWATVAWAFKETAGGGATYNAVPLLQFYQRLRRGIFH